MTRERVYSPLLAPPPAPGPPTIRHEPGDRPEVIARIIKSSRFEVEHPHRGNYPPHYFTCAACGLVLDIPGAVEAHHRETGHSAYTGIRLQKPA